MTLFRNSLNSDPMALIRAIETGQPSSHPQKTDWLSPCGRIGNVHDTVTDEIDGRLLAEWRTPTASSKSLCHDSLRRSLTGAISVP